MAKAKFELIEYDVWGNARDGFEVNQAFYTGKLVTIDLDMDDASINRSLAQQGVKGCKGIEWEGESDYTLYATLKRNGKPMGELRRV